MYIDIYTHIPKYMISLKLILRKKIKEKKEVQDEMKRIQNKIPVKHPYNCLILLFQEVSCSIHFLGNFIPLV